MWFSTAKESINTLLNVLWYSYEDSIVLLDCGGYLKYGSLPHIKETICCGDTELEKNLGIETRALGKDKYIRFSGGDGGLHDDSGSKNERARVDDCACAVYKAFTRATNIRSKRIRLC